MKENIYGHLKRLNWIKSHLDKKYKILELGCGTGYMITLPLAKQGYQAIGIDLDEESIKLGKQIFEKENVNQNCLSKVNLADINEKFDVIIASEVLEHISNEDLPEILSLIKEKLESDGIFLVTVPNGYGWFELESFLWFKLGLGRILDRLKLVELKMLILGKDIIYEYPSTISSSPHLQNFTYKSIQNLLKKNNFNIINKRGSVIFAGPFSNLFFTGLAPFMKFNCFLGDFLPFISSGFYIAAKNRKETNRNSH